MRSTCGLRPCLRPRPLACGGGDVGGGDVLGGVVAEEAGSEVAEAKGVIRLAFARASIPLSDYSPTAIKQAVSGSARAEKGQVQEMVKLILGLEEIPKPDHAADALAAAICLANHEGPLARL